MENKKGIHKIILAVYIVAILFLSTKYLGENTCISVIGDEFGYWSAAAFVLNKPWHSLAATNNYYGWGYGLILAPILHIFSGNPVFMYQTAIMVNAAMLCVMLLIIYMCTCRILNDKNKVSAALISGIIILFPSNIFAVYNTMPEIVLQLLYWFMTWIVLLITEKRNTASSGGRNQKLYILLMLIAVYGFGTHQRTVGLIIAVVLCWLYDILANREKLAVNTIVFFFVLVFLLLAVFIFKSFYMDWLYGGLKDGGTGDAGLANDFSGMASKLFEGFLGNRVVGILKSAIGKAWYSLISSALFVGAGLAVCLKKTRREKKEKRLPYIFILLGWLQAVGIAAIAMPQAFETRTDILIYGRYIEYTIGPLMMLGLAGMCEKKITHKQLAGIVIVQAVATLVVSRYIAADSINTNLGNIFTIARAFQKKSNQDAVYMCSLAAVSVFFAFFFMGKMSRYISKMRFIFFFCMEVFIVLNTYEAVTLPWLKQVNDNVHLNQIYHEEREECTLYVYRGGVGGKMMQFLNPNEECILVDEINEIEDGKMVVTQSSDKEEAEQIAKKYRVIYKNKILILWKKEP